MKAHKAHRQPKEFQEAVIQIDRVTRVVKGGRRLRFRATVCIGNHKGKVGIGMGKSKEVQGAIKKAVAQAKKNMITIQLDQNTVAHDVQSKFKSAKVLIKPASEGTGLIAGGAVRTVLELTGIKNVLTKSLGSNNKINTTKATIEALKMLRITPGQAMRLKTVQQKEEKAVKHAPAKQAPTGKKAAPKKHTAKKAAPKATTAKKETVKQAPTKKAAPKATTAKKETAKQAPAKKTAVKKETKSEN
jgi:small subunit ribosomal protein S5